MDTCGEQENTVDSTGCVKGDIEGTKNSLRGYTGDWFLLGVDQQLLERNCLALRRKFESEPRWVKKSGSGLRISLEACYYHAKEFTKFNSIGAEWTFRLKNELDNWCAVASLFLENYVNYDLFERTDETNFPPETKRVWPPASLPRDWFDFDKSFNLLFLCQDALHRACSKNNLMYPEDEECEDRYWRDLKIDNYDDANSTCEEDHWKLLKKENRVEEGKEYWRKLVVRLLKDLTSHREELTFK